MTDAEITLEPEGLDWRCAKCDCRTFARVDRLSDSGVVAFEPGDNVRCVNCKDVSFFPRSRSTLPREGQGEVVELRRELARTRDALRETTELFSYAMETEDYGEDRTSREEAFAVIDRSLDLLASPTAPLSPSPAVRDGVVGALREAEELLALTEHPAFPDPLYHEQVKALGRRIGFGALMSTASAAWREVAAERGDPAGAEFVAGPCFGSVQRTLGIVRRALSTQEQGNG